MFVPDNTIIREVEVCGMPEAPAPLCPVCGQECEDIYMDADGIVVGCDNCIRIMSALAIHECFE